MCFNNTINLPCISFKYVNEFPINLLFARKKLLEKVLHKSTRHWQLNDVIYFIFKSIGPMAAEVGVAIFEWRPLIGSVAKKQRLV